MKQHSSFLIPQWEAAACTGGYVVLCTRVLWAQHETPVSTAWVQRIVQIMGANISTDAMLITLLLCLPDGSGMHMRCCRTKCWSCRSSRALHNVVTGHIEPMRMHHWCTQHIQCKAYVVRDLLRHSRGECTLVEQRTKGVAIERKKLELPATLCYLMHAHGSALIRFKAARGSLQHRWCCDYGAVHM